ncbi:MAG TPA: L,D-transpeptidase family protein [Solirubrobacteraceae bacterium]|nr:L,D-transpeptidase family protein [Solirubrobacteraceae bacterium]
MRSDTLPRRARRGIDIQGSPAAPERRGGARVALLIVAGTLALVVAAFAGLALLGSSPKIVADGAALTLVDLPLTGGTIESATVTGPHGRPIPIAVRDGRLWPLVTLAPGEPVSVQVVLRRPGWIAWLAGNRVSEQLSLRTPSASLQQRYVTLAARSPLRLAFDQPVQRLAYGQPEHLSHSTLAQPSDMVTLTHVGEAGSIEVAAAPRSWERLPAASLVSWFPAGARASAVLSPHPGTRITPTTPLYVTFSEPVSAVLDRSLPHLEPASAGSWHTIDSHTIVFRPTGYGFGLDTGVGIALPHTVRLVAGHDDGSSSVASWTVPPGSTLRVQQILAQLGYLPLDFNATHALTASAGAQERAAVDPPSGSFSWRYGAVPGSLRATWSPGANGVMTRGALMAFESEHEMTTDGVLGPAVWRALIAATIANRRSTFGYTYVSVSEGSQSLSVWHDGSVRLTTPVNTGIASRPTELGTFPVYEHIASGTMSGTNPDGSHYEDPGIPWISYFNGGDALHGFERAQYGFPQSLGCVEMPPATAGRVWPYTPIGTLVHVE